MKAAYLIKHGGNESVVIGERPTPRRRTGEVLVRLRAATLNQVDVYMRNSGAGITHELPQILGVDGAGVVEETDSKGSPFRVGDSVIIHPGISCGHCEFCLQGDNPLCRSVSFVGEHRDGTFCEYISLPATNVFSMPEGLSYEQASALGVNYLTAWRMLFTKAKLKPWESVLIFGIGGGVSLAALHLARVTGAMVIVTSRDDRKLKKALKLGAHHAINSERQDVSKEVVNITRGRGVDVVIENVGEAVWSDALKSLVRGGRLITCGATSGDSPPADLRRIFIRQLQVIGSTLGSLSEFLDLISFISRHQIKPYVDKTFALDDVHRAFDYLESSRQFGKVAIKIS
jgi:NADPH:quinone reductase-like Zn-dependent oxidoreductase